MTVTTRHSSTEDRTSRRSQSDVAECPVLGLQRAALVVLMSTGLLANLPAQNLDTPMTRLRPIGAPSAVDRWIGHDGEAGSGFGASVVNARWETSSGRPETMSGPSADGSYTVRAQFQLPAGSGFPATTPPNGSSDFSTMAPPSLGTALPNPGGTVLGQTAPPVLSTTPSVPPPRSLPTGPAPMTMAPMTMAPMTMAPTTLSPTTPISSDLLPVAPPQLHDQFATIDNCSCVSAPSSYVAATGWTQCAPTTRYVSTPAPTNYLATPTTVTTPTAITTTVPAPMVAAPVIPDASTMPRGSGVPRHALINFGQNRNPVVVGQGIIGQPVAYVPGQWFRNWIRYVFP